LLNLGELALGLRLVVSSEDPPPGGRVPLGKDETFLLTSVEAVEVTSLFMLFIRSRTEAPLGFSPATGFSTLSPLLVTLVTSPDFRSTPTMDQGRGLGRGLGLGPTGGEDPSSLGLLPLPVLLVPKTAAAALGAAGRADLGLASGDGEDFFSRLVNFVDRRPRIEPPPLDGATVVLEFVVSLISMVSSPLFDRDFGENSLVGEVKFAARPVDLSLTPLNIPVWPALGLGFSVAALTDSSSFSL